MSGAWARPLEQILGEPLDRRLTAAALQRLADDRVPEGEQLDFKVSRYPTTVEGRGELAKDVCALANRQGGALILGVADVKGAASKPKPLDAIGDPDARHIRSVVASWCAPLPDVDVILVPAEAGSSDGFIVIVVPPSLRAPHAVAPPGEDSFKWPVRRGSQTDWLSESELADAYRSRASRVADEATRLDQLVVDAVPRLDTTAPWLVSVVVPAGSRPATPIDRQVVQDYTDWLRQAEKLVPSANRTMTYSQGIAGPRRVVFGDTATPGKPFTGTYADLHTDGASLHAQQLHQHDRPGLRSFNQLPDDTRILWEQLLAEFALVHLLLLCQHAVDNGGAWGEATIAMVLTDGGTERLAGAVALSRTRAMFPDVLGGVLVDHTAQRSTLTVDLTAVTSDGREAVIAARLLGGGLANVFGWPELSQYTADGRVRRSYFSAHILSAIEKWAHSHDVDLTDDPA